MGVKEVSYQSRDKQHNIQSNSLKPRTSSLIDAGSQTSLSLQQNERLASLLQDEL